MAAASAKTPVAEQQPHARAPDAALRRLDPVLDDALPSFAAVLRAIVCDYLRSVAHAWEHDTPQFVPGSRLAPSTPTAAAGTATDAPAPDDCDRFELPRPLPLKWQCALGADPLWLLHSASFTVSFPAAAHSLRDADVVVGVALPATVRVKADPRCYGTDTTSAAAAAGGGGGWGAPATALSWGVHSAGCAVDSGTARASVRDVDTNRPFCARSVSVACDLATGVVSVWFDDAPLKPVVPASSLSVLRAMTPHARPPRPCTFVVVPRDALADCRPFVAVCSNHSLDMGPEPWAAVLSDFVPPKRIPPQPQPQPQKQQPSAAK